MSELFVIVDMLNDFLRPEGKLYFPKGQTTIEPLVRLKAAYRAAGTPVLYVSDAHPENSEEFAVWPPHCLVGSWGARVVDELACEPDDLVLHKDALSFFSAPAAASLLRGLGVSHVVIAGVATEYCVRACALDAAARGHRVTVARDAIASVDIREHDGQEALDAMRQGGVSFADCAELLRGLAERRRKRLTCPA
ncbi:nicotinamidase [Fundidesulfovibrio butyratiphilus]